MATIQIEIADTPDGNIMMTMPVNLDGDSSLAHKAALKACLAAQRVMAVARDGYALDEWLDPNESPAEPLIDYLIVMFEETLGWNVDIGFMTPDGTWFLVGHEIPLKQPPKYYRPAQSLLPEHLAAENRVRENLAHQRTEWPVDGDGSPIDRQHVAPEAFA